MLIEIDFNSNEAIYVQLQNQIIMGIATDAIREGDTLPSVRQLADTVLLAKGCCKNISREDVHALVDEIFDEYRR